MLEATAILLFLASVFLIVVAISNQRKSHLDWYPPDSGFEYSRGQLASEISQLRSIVVDKGDPPSTVTDSPETSDRSKKDTDGANLPAVVKAENTQNLVALADRIEENAEVLARFRMQRHGQMSQRQERAKDIRDWTMAGVGILGTTVAGSSIVDWVLTAFQMGVVP